MGKVWCTKLFDYNLQLGFKMNWFWCFVNLWLESQLIRNGQRMTSTKNTSYWHYISMTLMCIIEKVHCMINLWALWSPHLVLLQIMCWSLQRSTKLNVEPLKKQSRHFVKWRLLSKEHKRKIDIIYQVTPIKWFIEIIKRNFWLFAAAFSFQFLAQVEFQLKK